MITFYYSSAYFPSAPIVQIKLQHPDGTAVTELISAFVDSGADATIVPEAILSDLGTQSDDEGVVVSAWGSRKRVAFHMIDILLGDTLIPSIDVLADPHVDEVILGRDVLNQFRIILDGVGGVVEIEI